jgi:hypothetical protein
MKILNCMVIAVLIVLLASSCKVGRPARKTLPDELSDGTNSAERSWEATNGSLGAATQNREGFQTTLWPIYANDTVVKGKILTAIYLPNPAYDSLVWDIIKSYEPFAVSVFNMISERETKGIIVDLRQNSDSQKGMAEFSVYCDTDQKSLSRKSNLITVLFYWDGLSSYRAAFLIDELKSSFLLKVRNTRINNSFSTIYKQDCFIKTVPNFDEQ